MGARGGRGALYVPVRGQSGRGSLLGEGRAGEAREVAVDVISLDEFVAAEPPESLRAVKVDAEGYELEILAGAGEMLRRYRPG